MKRIIALCAAILAMVTAFPCAALASAEALYPASIERSADGKEIRKIYELGPEDNPAGIPRSDFEQAGFRYTFLDLLKQDQAEYEEKEHIETVELESEKKDMEAVLSLLPQEQDFVTEDGYAGTLTLKLDTIRVEPKQYAGYTQPLTATRSYPNLLNQDTSGIPKTLDDGSGNTLTLQNIDWQTANTQTVDGYAVADRYTAVATYTGSRFVSYVRTYAVTADYTGTVSRIALDKVRYVAIFEGTSLNPEPEETPEPTPEPIVIDLSHVTPPEPEQPAASFNWTVVWVLLGVIALAGGGIGLALALKRRNEMEDEEA